MKDLEYPEYKEQKKIDYLNVGDDELEKLAAADTERSVAEKKSGLDKNFYDATQKAQKKLEKAGSESSEKIADITADYNSAADKLKRGELKNGMARSSYAFKADEAVADDYGKNIAAAVFDANKQIKSIESEIKTLNDDYNRAVESLNVGKSVAIKQRLNELKAEQVEKIKQIEKYNAAIDENKRLYDAAKEKHDKEAAATKNEIKRKFVVDVINRLRGLSESEANELLSDKDVIAALGDDLDYIRRTYETFK